jgi:DNA polymerase I-like protein with 3'-5' exonuclease and polymerase domains
MLQKLLQTFGTTRRQFHHQNHRLTKGQRIKAIEVCSIIRGYQERKKPISFDIEGRCNWVTCYSIADSKDEAVVVPFIYSTGVSAWNEADEIMIWEATRDLLEDVAVPKILQNYLYDAFVLLWTYGIVIAGLEDDTMLGHFENYPELEKSLGFQASIYTNEPYYKSERKSDDEMTQLIYCGKDACVTFECNDIIKKKMMPKQAEHYRFNVSLLAPLLYMSLRGIKYDKATAVRRLAEVQEQIYEKQDEINREASTSRTELADFYKALETTPNNLVPIFARAFCKARRVESREVEETTWQPYRWNRKKWVKDGKRIKELPQVGTICVDANPPSEKIFCNYYKPITKTAIRNLPVEIRTFEDVQRFAKDSCATNCKKAIQLSDEYKHSQDSSALRGQLATLLDIHVKINATNAGGDAQWYLYEHCKLPPQYQKEGNKLTTKLATDDEAVIKAWVASKDPRALTFLALRKLITTTKYLTASPDSDGRLRFALNLVATPTGRMAGYGSPTGSSDINPQTIGKGIRDLFPADDEDHLLGQFDLDGSDSWTVAAYAASLGDSTMLNDNLARLKPAKILACIYEQGPDVNKLDHTQLRAECKKVDGEGWLYFACKRVLHGSNYGMGKLTMANQILTDSYKLLGKPVHLDGATCERIQKQAFFVRYPGVLNWHAWMKRELKEKGVLIACNGFQRHFYGRKDDHGTLKEALAHTPQVLTTYGITSTLSKLWNDPENRNPNGSFKVEALLCVHDSLIMQWHKQHTEWAATKIKSWFQQKMTVNGIDFNIPVNGTAGPNWKYQGSEKYAKEGGIDL